MLIMFVFIFIQNSIVSTRDEFCKMLKMFYIL